MRTPQDLPRQRPRRAGRRKGWWILVAVVVLVVLFSLRTLATFYTDYLWFGSVHFGQVWRTIFEVKVGLFFGFAAIFFVVLWVNLAVVDRLAPSQLMLGPEDELVRRYQQHVAPRAVLVRTLVSVVIGLIAASGVIGQWKNYLMFMNGVPFSSTDPQFHKNVAFFVFELPFLSFLVSWAFVSLVVIAIFTVIAHYLNGGIRIQSGSPNVAPQVKVHLSVLLACMALVKAFGYVLARYNLDLSQNGYVQGATYTDVHARLPAYTLLIWISVLAAIIFLVNIRRRGWALPVLGVGLWAFVAVVIGAIYPAIVQAIKVNPAQNSLERPYIARNISATRAALGLNKVSVQGFNAGQSLTPSQVMANEATLNNVQLWDPTQTSQTYTKLQAIRSYYSFNTLAVDRYKIDGTIDPTVIGVRQVNDSDLPQSGWVNTHLQYTHGYAGFLAPSNAANEGNPSFAVSNVPAQSAAGAPVIKQPRVYFGIANPNGGDANYVLADTRQPEIDYQVSDASNPVTSTYHGTGGVQLTNDFKKLAFAIRFGDFNLLVSNLVTSHSRLMFVRDVTQMAQKAAPFLSFDSDPYPVVVDGQIYWVLDAYTTTDNYPYAQNVDTSSLAANSGLNQNFNYVRNSVKVVVNAYSGAMKFYDVTALTHTKDPILQMWEKVFPGMFTPVSDVSPKALVSHFRYPEDLLTVQAATYGRYHITQPLAFYNATNAWNVSESAGSGPPNQALPTTLTTNAQGQVVNTGQVVRMSPEYEVFQVPGQSSQSYNLVDAFSPVSQGDQIQTMSGFIVAGSDPGNYGKLTVFQTPAIEGPALIDADIAATQKISSQISLLNQNGSSVLLGTLQFVPVGNAILYFRPFYVESSRNPFPQLDYYIVVYSGQQGQSQVAFETTLTGALQDLFQVSVPNQSSSSSSSGSSSSSSSGSSSTVSQHIQSLIAQAATDFQQSQTDLKAGNFAAYGTDQQNLQNVLTQLQQATQAAKTTSPTTTKPKATSATSTTDASTSTTSGGVALGRRSGHGSTS